MSKWIEFLPAGMTAVRKTKIFDVIAIQGGVRIGEIKWYPGWRRYCFFPIPQSLFEEQCLRDIADFCQRETNARRAARKQERLVA